jgi:glycosyltransferase involved in cell wall biosynthesis
MGQARRRRGQAQSTDRRPRLTVCMIVRDEAENLRRALASVAGVADEVVVVDTGSTDDSAAVAGQLGARVGHFRWCDDFAAARNAALAMARGAWVLSLDAD